LELDKDTQVFDQACPLFVPLAEEGWDSDPVTNLIVFRYLSQLLQHSIDTLILGCTHYPILKNSIARVTGSTIELVDSGEAIAHWLERDFTQGRVGRSDAKEHRQVQIMTTDSSAHFTELALRILKPLKADEFKVVDL
jgi:glutamate racemase